MKAEHFLGERPGAGDTLYQVVEDGEGRWCGLLLWCSASLKLKERDVWIGWDHHQRSERLKLVINNARFLIPDAARKPNMASRVLAVAASSVGTLYEERYGYRPLLAETFTDPRHHKGTCYRAAGWAPLGETAGYGREREDFYTEHGAAKCIWVRPLEADATARLRARELGPQQQAARVEGKGAHRVLPSAQRRSLYEALREVPDPRRAAGRQYPAAAVLTVVCLGLLSGAGTLSSIHRLVVRMSDAERRHIGFRAKRGTQQYPPPSYHTIRHLLRLMDLHALAGVLNGWLQEHAGLLPRHLALDGKDVRNSLGMIVSLVDTETGIPVALTAAPGKGHEFKAAQRLLRSEEVCLEGMCVSADALHCQRETARIITHEKGGDYVLQVKGNQPSLQDVARFAVPESSPFLP